jgi:hypothetical protein
MTDSTTPVTPVTSRTNVLAIVSLVAGIAGLVFVPLIGGIVAVITGHLARKEIRTTGESGDGLAKGGLITGYIGLGFSALAIIVVVIVFGILAASGAMMYNY